MWRLSLFGGVVLSREAGATPSLQRRPLALLTILAVHGERGIGRERLLLYLWPDSTARLARATLSQTLYILRRELGRDALAGGANLALDARRIACDLWDYETALAAGDLERAVTLHCGPLFGSFALSHAPEFERWLSEARARDTDRLRATLETLATRAAAAGDHATAAAWWRRLALDEPYSSRIALRGARALDAAGDRAGAAAWLETHTARVRGDLGLSPDPEVHAALDVLRRPAARVTVAAPPSADPAVVPVDRAPDATASRVPSPRRDRPAARRAAGLAGALTVGLVLGLGVYDATRAVWPRGQDGDGVVRAQGRRLIVFPFATLGPSENRWIADALVALLAAGLDGAGDLRASVAARPAPAAGAGTDGLPESAWVAAGRLGADLFVSGEAIESGGRVRVRGSLYQTASPHEPLASATAEGPADDLFAIADRLAIDLAVAVTPRQVYSASLLTRSVPALKAYLEAESSLDADEYAKALDALERAVGEDPAFALAHYRMSVAADLAGRPGLAQAAAARAAQESGRLPERERLLLSAHSAWQDGQTAAAERLYRQVAAQYAGDAEAAFGLGEVLFHGNPLRGRSFAEARAPFEQVVGLEPDNLEAMIHLARIAYFDGRTSAADSLERRARLIARDGHAIESRAFRSFVLGDHAGIAPVTRRLRQSPTGIGAPTALRVAVRLDDPEEVRALADALARDAAAETRAFAHRLLGDVALARGRAIDADLAWRTSGALESVPALERRCLHAAQPEFSFAPDLVASIRQEVLTWPVPDETGDVPVDEMAHAGSHAAIRLHCLGLLDLRLMQRTEAERHADDLDRAASAAGPGTLATTLAFSLRAHLARARGRDAEALALLEGAGWEHAGRGYIGEVMDRWLRADLLERLGRDEEALGWFASMAQRASYELPYLAPAQLRQAWILERRGETELANLHYTRFFDLWQDCDPPLAVLREAARSGMADARR